MTHSRWTLSGPVAATIVAIVGSSVAAAQSRYEQQPYPQAPGAPYAPYQAYQQPVQPQTLPYQVGSQLPPTYQVAQQQSMVQPQTVPPGYGSYQLPNYQAPAPGSRYSVAQAEPVGAPHPESVPAPPTATPPVMGQPTPTPPSAPLQYNEAYPQDYQSNSFASGDGGRNTAAPAGSWEGYVQAPAAGYGCESGTCGTGAGYNHDCDYGAFGGPSGHVLGERLMSGDKSCRQWFFGVYALGMTRDNPSYHKFAASVNGTPAAYPYYPTQDTIVLSTNDIQPDWQWGAEVRFGSTFGSPCGSCGGGLRPYAWEVVYWGLAEDDQTATVTDSLGDSDRLYGQINYAGLQYDLDGGGATYANRPMNDYMDYGMPVQDPTTTADDVRLLAVRARSTFSAQNLELNFIRFPLTTCNSCNSCNPCASPRFTINGTCGVRYMKLDEDLRYSMFTTVGTPGTPWTPDAGMPSSYPGGFPTDMPNSIFHNISVDNELVGFQFGSNMNWLIGCKWSAFCDTQLGIYGNHINAYQTVYGGSTGYVSWTNNGNPVAVRSSKTDVSFLGELRAGLGYQVGCNCRLTAAYRVIAITGVALGGEQIPTDWSSSNYVGIIDSNDSLVLHGVQTGVEWRY